ncbi:hypothetical protein BASA81_013957 [Batrachochytrium salamandrivorans]|nr:hypothetical protein BASA81_013957 [Batrachochytrium salamandrivorans]
MSDDWDDYGQDDEDMGAILAAVEAAEQTERLAGRAQHSLMHDADLFTAAATITNTTTAIPRASSVPRVSSNERVNTAGSAQTAAPLWARNHRHQQQHMQQPQLQLQTVHLQGNSNSKDPTQLILSRSGQLKVQRSHVDTGVSNSTLVNATSAAATSATGVFKLKPVRPRQVGIPSTIQQQQQQHQRNNVADGNVVIGSTIHHQRQSTDSSTGRSANETHPSFPHTVDDRELLTWIYPTNYPVRDYQFNIVSKALFSNTLVALPTGLGKTFLAAVIMFNYYRWFPKGKIIFMAPTKPLVAQQIEACYKITGIPQSDSRAAIWDEKRVFFLTPQVMQNDLRSSSCPADKVVLLIVDEAHRATGNYAYCEVIRELAKSDIPFRVIGLSATPGSDIKAVQSVVENLMIQHIEIRTEDSLDIRPFIFNRKIDEIVVSLTPQIVGIVDAFSKVVSVYLGRLCNHGAFYERDPRSVTRFSLLEARKRWMDTHKDANRSLIASIMGDSGICMSLCAALQHLQQYGIRAFYDSVLGFLEEGVQAGPDKISRSRQELLQNPDLKALMNHLSIITQTPSFSSHPKLERLVAIVLEHFSHTLPDHSNEGLDQPTPVQTRVMIFSQFRDTVEEIVSKLNMHQPLLRVMSFIGQASSKSGLKGKGFTQKEQLEVISKFQSGNYNILVSTSIGEEGLDIGEIDLIICYDAQTSPVRMLQRMGRTGRKRQGRIVVILSKGKEEENHRRAQAQYKSVQRSIMEGHGKRIQMYAGPLSRVLPPNARPTCDQRALVIPNYERPKTAAVSKQKGAVTEATAASLELDKLLELDQKQYGHIDPNTLDLSLDRFPYWQSRLLPEKHLSRTSRSILYVHMIELCEGLSMEEESGTSRSEVEKMKSDLEWTSVRGGRFYANPTKFEDNGSKSLCTAINSSTQSDQHAITTAANKKDSKSKRKHSRISGLPSSDDSDDVDFEDDSMFDLDLMGAGSNVKRQSTASKRKSKPSRLTTVPPSSSSTQHVLDEHILSVEKTLTESIPRIEANPEHPKSLKRNTLDSMDRVGKVADIHSSIHASKSVINNCEVVETYKQPRLAQSTPLLLKKSDPCATALNPHTLTHIVPDKYSISIEPTFTAGLPLVCSSFNNPQVDADLISSQTIPEIQQFDSPNKYGILPHSIAGDDIDQSSENDDQANVDPYYPMRLPRKPQRLCAELLEIPIDAHLGPSLDFNVILNSDIQMPISKDTVLPLISTPNRAATLIPPVSNPLLSDSMKEMVETDDLSDLVDFDEISDTELANISLSQFSANGSWIATSNIGVTALSNPQPTVSSGSDTRRISKTQLDNPTSKLQSYSEQPSLKEIHAETIQTEFDSSKHFSMPVQQIFSTPIVRTPITETISFDGSSTIDSVDIRIPKGRRPCPIVDELSSPPSIADGQKSILAESMAVFKTPRPISRQSCVTLSPIPYRELCSSGVSVRKEKSMMRDEGPIFSTPDTAPRQIRRSKAQTLSLDSDVDIKEDDQALEIELHNPVADGYAFGNNNGGQMYDVDMESPTNDNDDDDNDNDDGLAKRPTGRLKELIERKSKKQVSKRKAPRQRSTPIIASKPIKSSSRNTVPKRRSKKAVRAIDNPFLDMEAQLSSDADSVSSDENSGGEVGTDTENSFIVNDGEVSSQSPALSGKCSGSLTPAMDMQAFYRASLLSPCLGGLGRRNNGARFRLAKRQQESPSFDSMDDDEDEDEDEDGDINDNNDVDDILDNLPSRPLSISTKKEQQKLQPYSNTRRDPHQHYLQSNVGTNRHSMANTKSSGQVLSATRLDYVTTTTKFNPRATNDDDDDDFETRLPGKCAISRTHHQSGRSHLEKHSIGTPHFKPFVASHPLSDNMASHDFSQRFSSTSVKPPSHPSFPKQQRDAQRHQQQQQQQQPLMPLDAYALPLVADKVANTQILTDKEVKDIQNMLEIDWGDDDSM